MGADAPHPFEGTPMTPRLLLLSALLALPGSAAGETPPPAPPGPPVEVDIAFADGSNVKAVLLEPALSLSTRYGKLTIPASDVRRVETGMRYPEGVERRVAEAVARLASPEYRDREKAGKELAELRLYAVPALRLAVKGGDPTRRERAGEALRQVTAGLSEAEQTLLRRDEDTVVAAAFTARGRLDGTSLRVRTWQFGEATVRLAEVRELRAAAAGASGAEVTLDGARHARLNWSGWLDTGVDVSPDSPLEVRSTGRLDQWPQEPGQYTCGPGGGQAMAPNAPAAGRGPGGRVAFGPDGQPVGGFRSGAVVGRVGDSGRPFLVGENYKAARAPGAGRLFLLIAPSNWNNDECAGEYKVTVRVGE